MIIQLMIEGDSYAADVSTPAADLSIPITPYNDAQLEAFFLPRAHVMPFMRGHFIGDTRRGARVNCDIVTFCPHGNGTHTEGVGHITRARLPVTALLDSAFIPATVLSTEPQPLAADECGRPWTDAADLVVSQRSLEDAYARLRHLPSCFLQALVIRTLPNPLSKRGATYSGRNPPYFTLDAVAWMLAHNVRHLLVDLPSIDREEDGGILSAHRQFWSIGPLAEETSEPSRRTITELCYVPDSVPDGIYLLNLQVAPIELDAAPCRPLLFRIL